MRTNMDKGLNIEQLRRENMLKAMRANREQIVYDTKKEITPAEQFQMQSKQYKRVVKEQSKTEKDTLSLIKSNILQTEIGKDSVNDRTIDIKRLNDATGSQAKAV